MWLVDEPTRYLFPVMTEVLIPSYVGGLGITLWIEGDLALGRAEVQPEFFKPGTDRVRLGVLATLVDMVAGSPAHAIINPTVDLRVSLLDHAPTSGAIELVTYPVKSGRQLFVGETVLHTGDPERPFARSVCTFINKPLLAERSDGVYPTGQLGHDSYDESLRLREPEPGVFEMDNHDVVRNGANGTVQGGAQALLAELAGERALADVEGEYEAVDLEIRYLNRVRTGPVRATGELLAGGFDGRWVRVSITEPPADDRIVALTTLQFRPAS
jgi:acyl-coenzyme A thioesterase PaaI-like protein